MVKDTIADQHGEDHSHHAAGRNRPTVADRDAISAVTRTRRPGYGRLCAIQDRDSATHRYYRPGRHYRAARDDVGVMTIVASGRRRQARPRWRWAGR